MQVVACRVPDGTDAVEHFFHFDWDSFRRDYAVVMGGQTRSVNTQYALRFAAGEKTRM